MPAPADRVRCTDPKAYKTQARNIFANIDAADNPTFRLRVLTGQIPATAVATLQAGAMASAEQQAKNSKIDQDALYHGQAAQAEPTEGIFQCGKCKSDKVRFALAQVSRRVSVRVYRRPILLQFARSVSSSCAPRAATHSDGLLHRAADAVWRRADDGFLLVCDLRQSLEVLIVASSTTLQHSRVIRVA